MRGVSSRLAAVWHTVNPFTPAGWVSVGLVVFWVVVSLWLVRACA